jgi:hypothetical protein
MNEEKTTQTADKVEEKPPLTCEADAFEQIMGRPISKTKFND